MGPEEIRDIIVTLINNEYFPKHTENEAERLAKDIALFTRTYYEEIKK